MAALRDTWSIPEEDKLIELWRERPCLYDVGSVEYSNRDMKDAAFNEIAELTSKSIAQIQRRMRSLRTMNVKAKKNPPSGSSGKSPSRRASWILEKLQFLTPFIAMRSGSTTSNMESGDEENDDLDSSTLDDDNQDSAAGEVTQTALKRPASVSLAGNLKKRRDEQELEILKGLAMSISQKSTGTKEMISDELSSFATYIEQSLRKMDQNTQNLVKHNIQNIIFQAQFGTLQGQSNQYANLTPLRPWNDWNPSQSNSYE